MELRPTPEWRVSEYIGRTAHASDNELGTGAGGGKAAPPGATTGSTTASMTSSLTGVFFFFGMAPVAGPGRGGGGGSVGREVEPVRERLARAELRGSVLRFRSKEEEIL